MVSPGQTWSLYVRAMVLFVLQGVVASSIGQADDLFIDPSRTNGCPGSGTYTNPYCDWNEIKSLVGGNRYLQRSGTLSTQSVKIIGPVSATAERPVAIGAYGDGPRPRIRVENDLVGALVADNWKRVRRSVWSLSTKEFRVGNPAVLLLNGRRAFGGAQREADLCGKAGAQLIEWFHAGDTLYLCSPRGNPAEIYSSITGMQRATNEPWVPVYIENQAFVVIDGLMIEGGSLGAIEIRGSSSNIEIRNSVIGVDSFSGIRAQSFTDPIKGLSIHDNVFDSGVRWGMAGYEVAGGEGVHFVAGVEDSTIYRNTFVAWPHNGIYLDAHWPDSPGVRRNIIRDNEFHCGPGSSYFDYCRPFGVDGFKADSARDNVFAGNRMHDFSVAAQLNGNNNFIVGNVCYNTINSKAKSFPTGQCFSMQPYVWSRDNLVANNTMVSLADVAVQFIPGVAGVSAGHRVVNNIMYDCGKATVSTRRDACIAVAPDVSVGPQEISNNLMYNPGRPVRVLYRRDWSEDFVKLKARYDDRVAANLLIDPLLRDTERADFNLRPGSPAIGAGRPVEVPGLAMPGAFRDVGAVQSPAGTAQGAVP